MKGVSRDLAGLPQTLSKRLPYAVRVHGALTRSVVRLVIQWVRDGLDPPPPLSGIVLGTYLSAAYAAYAE
jgi:hypothetical protein